MRTSSRFASSQTLLIEVPVLRRGWSAPAADSEMVRSPRLTPCHRETSLRRGGADELGHAPDRPTSRVWPRPRESLRDWTLTLRVYRGSARARRACVLRRNCLGQAHSREPQLSRCAPSRWEPMPEQDDEKPWKGSTVAGIAAPPSLSRR